MRILILGAGPTGLGAAWRLTELGHTDFTVLEGSDRLGGLAGSWRDENGFLWDAGIHALHSHYPYFDEVMRECKIEFNEHRRKAYAYMFGKWVPYPVQYNLHHFPPQIAYECAADMFENTFRLTPHSFYDYLTHSFGHRLTEVFLRPYNEKIWATSLNQMGLSWMGERVPPVDLKKVMYGLATRSDSTDWGPNSAFLYPKKGGTGAIWSAVAKRLVHRIQFLKQVFQISTHNKFVQCDDGTCHKYDALISTTPLDILCQMCDAPFENKWLRKTTTHVVGLGVNGKLPLELENKNWIYFPGYVYPFYRATPMSLLADDVAPRDAFGGGWSIMMECASTPDFKPGLSGPDQYIDACKQSLVDMGLVRPVDVVSKWYRKHTYGYPVPTLERDRVLGRVIPMLEGVNIYSRGRFGFWKYEVSNQDHSFMQGVEVVNRILHGEAETVARL